MTKLKKMTAVLLSMVMFMCCFAVQASAESIYNTAKAISSGKSYSTQLYNDGDTADYKITATKSGSLVIKLTSQMYRTDVYVYDSDGNMVQLSDRKATSGEANWDSYDYCSYNYWNETVEKFAGTLTYGIKKGTYYIRFERYIRWSNTYSGNGKINFTATFPTSTSSSTAKINYLSIPMKVGSTMQLSAVLSKTTIASVTWSSSKSSVASVSSKGKVTAKKAGSTVITAKLGTSTVKLRIKVTK